VSPFPTRPVLPAEESTELVRRTSRSRRRGVPGGRSSFGGGSGPAPVIAVEDEYGRRFAPPSRGQGELDGFDDRGRYGRRGDGDINNNRASRSWSRSRSPSPGPVEFEPDKVYDPRAKARSPMYVHPGKEDDMRSDVALFFFPPENPQQGRVVSALAPESVYSGRSSFLGLGRADDVNVDDGAAMDDVSVYARTFDTRPSTATTARVDSYYFSGDGASSRPASFVDDERSRDMRETFLRRVGAMYEEDEDEVLGVRGRVGRGDARVPPVPALPAGLKSYPTRF
jgi:hypothetical protein